jgi:hypothetical protein
VDVVGDIGGWVEVDHQRDGVDVDASSGDVGGNEHVEPTIAERRQGALTLALGAVSVDGG